MSFLPAILTSKVWFPDPRLAARAGRHAGLLAVGGDLTVPRLLLAYQTGLFPWSDDPISWWSPDPRGIFELDHFHTPRSLERVLRSGRFRVTVNQAFQAVMEGCAAPMPGRQSTWISAGFIQAYVRLHQAGHAHSVECWLGEDLVGGIYGVAIGGLFAGESMFHRASDASKVALVHLADRLRHRGFTLFDIQMLTSITRRLGAVEISRDEYLRRLAIAVKHPCSFG